MIQVEVKPDKISLGKAAAEVGATAIRQAIATQGHATIVVATGASQFEMLEVLTSAPDIDWARVSAFHLDEYVGLPETHPASFRRYLRERFVARLPTLGSFCPIAGDAPDIAAELARITKALRARPIDVMFAGIGENGHLAFNDPPANFADPEAYRVVDLDTRCRNQQLGEGWFATLEDVPRQAVSMTVPQIMTSKIVVLAVPDARKAEAVRGTLEGPVSPMVPASVLRRHPACHLFLDPDSASLLRSVPKAVGA